MKNTKRMMLLLSLVIVLVMGAGATLAYIHMNTQAITNTFEPTQVSCDVQEDITTTPGKKADVKIKNTSNIDAFIRAEVVVTWKKMSADADGKVTFETYGKAPLEGTDYTIKYNGESDTLKNSGWVEGDDGFYYCTTAIAEGGFTPILIKECAALDTAPDGYYLSVEIIASAIQAEGESFGAPTGEEGQKPAEIAWSNDFVTIEVNDAADKLTVKNN